MSHHKAINFPSTRYFKLWVNKGKIFFFCDLHPKVVHSQFPCVLPKNCDVRVLIRILSFLLTITSNKGSIRIKFHFFPIYPQKLSIPICFFPKNYDVRVFIRLSSFHLPVTSNKGSIKVKSHFVQLTPKKYQFTGVFA